MFKLNPPVKWDVNKHKYYTHIDVHEVDMGIYLPKKVISPQGRKT